MTGFVGALISVVCRARFFIDIRDIFPENIALIYNETVTTLFVPFFRILESFSIKRATKVILVSAGFLPYFQSRFPKISFKVFTHGVDSTFIFTTPTEVEPHHGKQRKTVLYAGNIGEGQGLEEILPFLAKKTEAQFDFLVYGDGARRSELLTRIKELNLTNIHVLSPISREFLANEYAKADILFLNLRKYTPFQWVIPSKIFEYAATGKPIVAGVSGYTQQFIESNLMNVEIFQPGNLEQALQALEKINLKSTDRSEFIVKYRRENIMHDLVDEIAS
jgi:glycosyltransferase involved in cell wall biosynthesis